MRHPGRLIVLEGPDGVGKTTLARAVAAKLATRDVECTYAAFPGNDRGTVGELVYRLHHQSKALGVEKIRPTPLQVLHVAAHIDAIESTLAPTLAHGTSVVLDRYWWSTWVYGLLSGMSRDVLEALIDLERRCWGSVLPTLVALIERDTPFRHETAHEHWEPLVHTYHALGEREATLYPVRIVRNDRPVDVVAADIVALACNLAAFPAPFAVDSKASQLTLSLPPISDRDTRASITVSSRMAGPHLTKPTEVFDAYWRLAAERQAIFFRRFRGAPQPWTRDPVLLRHKFTNAYRASDRVSQFLIRHVSYKGDEAPEEVFFRTILFKLFNRIETWLLLTRELGGVSYREYSHSRYDTILHRALERGEQIYSGAYIMPPVRRDAPLRKHTGHLLLLESMMKDELPSRLAEARSLREAFELLRAYPVMGDFLAYQYIIDLNYGPLLNFSEMEFIVPGPGARRGIGKCFADLGGLSEADIIRLVTDGQAEQFARRGLPFESLWGRPLQLIDCQNLFCEVDKYARVVFPERRVAGGGKRIKQVYRPTAALIDYWYPPKWGLNEKIEATGRPRQ